MEANGYKLARYAHTHAHTHAHAHAHAHTHAHTHTHKKTPFIVVKGVFFYVSFTNLFFFDMVFI